MNNYVCRGIIKWAPFDGLAGFNDLYNELKYRLNKQNQPLLSDEQLHYMDLNLKEAFYNHKEVSISYFRNGYINNLYGEVTKIDPMKMRIFLDGVPLNIKQIVNLEII